MKFVANALEKMGTSLFKYDYSLPGSDAVQPCKWLPSFRRNVSFHFLEAIRGYKPEDHDPYLHRLASLKSRV